MYTFTIMVYVANVYIIFLPDFISLPARQIDGSISIINCIFFLQKMKHDYKWTQERRSALPAIL